jgi:predicted regulator of Ras-like GTPase activity (Roadblock/LC7/MglB family)
MVKRVERIIGQLNRVKGAIGYYIIDLDQQVIERVELKDPRYDDSQILEKLQRVIPLLETDVTNVLIENGEKIFIRKFEEGHFFVFVTSANVIVGVILKILERF